jgi:hypothetical protein
VVTAIPKQVLVECDLTFGIHHDDSASTIMERLLTFTSSYGFAWLFKAWVPFVGSHQDRERDDGHLVTGGWPVHNHDIPPIFRKHFQSALLIDRLGIDGVIRAGNLLDIINCSSALAMVDAIEVKARISGLTTSFFNNIKSLG